MVDGEDVSQAYRSACCRVVRTKHNVIVFIV